MRVQELLPQVQRNLKVDYVGDNRAQIRGFTTRTGRRHVARKFYVLPERAWHPQHPDLYLKKDDVPEEKLREAIENGAAGIVCPENFARLEFLYNTNCVFVENTRKFLFSATDCLRRSLKHQKIVAITGSVGKSTTRQMLVHVLQSLSDGRSVRPKRRHGNLYSQVLREISAAPMADFSVLEVAASSIRELEDAAYTISPDVAVVTAISEAHLKTFKNTARIADRKSGIFAKPPAGGSAVINLDTAHSDILIERAETEGCQVITYGKSHSALVRLVSYDYNSSAVTAMVEGTRVSYKIAVPGWHMAYNSLAVASTLLALGEARWEEALQSLDSFVAVRGRGTLLKIHIEHNVLIYVVDESYNANPASMRAALDSFTHRPIPPGARRIAVLGDMLELGPDSQLLHQSIANVEGLEKLDAVYLFGPDMSAAFEPFADIVSATHYCSTLEELVALWPGIFRANDYVLAKASLGMGLNAAIQRMSKIG